MKMLKVRQRYPFSRQSEVKTGFIGGVKGEEM